MKDRLSAPGEHIGGLGWPMVTKAEHYELAKTRTEYSPPSSETMAEIRNYVTDTYPGALEFLQKFVHADDCQNNCLTTYTTEIESCRRWNLNVRCFRRHNHLESGVLKEHVCVNCRRLLSLPIPHRATCETCPVRLIQAEMEKKEKENV